MGDNDGVNVDETMPTRGRDHLFLGRRDHAVQILDLVLEDLDELHDTAIADVQCPIKFQYPRIPLRVKVQLGNVLTADQDRGILVVGIDWRNNADADPRSLGKLHCANRKLLILAAEFFSQPKTANRAEISLHVNAQHLLKFFSQMARYQMKRLFKHWAAFDGIDGIAFFQAPVQFL